MSRRPMTDAPSPAVLTFINKPTLLVAFFHQRNHVRVSAQEAAPVSRGGCDTKCHCAHPADHALSPRHQRWAHTREPQDAHLSDTRNRCKDATGRASNTAHLRTQSSAHHASCDQSVERAGQCRAHARKQPAQERQGSAGDASRPPAEPEQRCAHSALYT